jgi:hypothetical protein
MPTSFVARRATSALPYVQRVDLDTSRLLIVACAEHSGGAPQRAGQRQTAISWHPHQHPDHRSVGRYAGRSARAGGQVDWAQQLRDRRQLGDVE